MITVKINGSISDLEVDFLIWVHLDKNLARDHNFRPTKMCRPILESWEPILIAGNKKKYKYFIEYPEKGQRFCPILCGPPCMINKDPEGNNANEIIIGKATEWMFSKLLYNFKNKNFSLSFEKQLLGPTLSMYFKDL